MSGDNTESCRKCKSQFKPDRICISKECSANQYLSLICKLCHYSQHKDLGRHCVSELDFDIFKKDIEEETTDFLSKQSNGEQLSNLTKQARLNIKEIITKLENYDKILEEFESKHNNFGRNVDSLIQSLNSEEENIKEESIKQLFDTFSLTDKQIDGKKKQGQWKLINSDFQTKCFQVEQLSSIVDYIEKLTNSDDINYVCEEVELIQDSENSIIELQDQIQLLQEKLRAQELDLFKSKSLNGCNKLVKEITRYFNTWLDYSHISIDRYICSNCKGYFYFVLNMYSTKKSDLSYVSTTLCNNCCSQGDPRQSKDPEGTSTFYYYSHERSSNYIKTRNAQPLYEFYQQNQQILNTQDGLNTVTNQ